MIKRCYILPYIVFLLAVACTKPATDPVFSLQEYTVDFEETGGTKELSLTINNNWTASVNAPWCRVFPASGSATYVKEHSIRLICDLNKGEDRSCNIVIRSNGEEKTVNVSQMHASLFTDVFDYSISFHKQFLPIPCRATGDISVETDDLCSNWIQHATTKAPLARDTVWLSVMENRGGLRVGTIYLSCGAKTDTVRIQQDAQLITMEDKNLYRHILNTCDSDLDCQISVEEAERVTRIYYWWSADYVNVTSAQGLEYFPNLKELVLSTYVLHEFDFSLFKKLETVQFRGPLDGADFSKNDLLQSLTLECTTGGTFCMKNLKRLKRASVATFSELDYEGCDSLEVLQIAGYANRELKLPASSSIRDLQISSSSLEELDISDLPFLTSCQIKHTALTTLDMTAQTGLKKLTTNENDALKYLIFPQSSSFSDLDIGNSFSLEKLDLSSLPSLSNISISITGLTALDLTAQTRLTKLSLSQNWDLTELDMPTSSSFSDLNIYQAIRLNKLDLSGLPSIVNIIINHTRLTTLDLTAQTKLEYLKSYSNDYLETIYVKFIPKYLFVDKETEVIVVD